MFIILRRRLMRSAWGIVFALSFSLFLIGITLTIFSNPVDESRPEIDNLPNLNGGDEFNPVDRTNWTILPRPRESLDYTRSPLNAEEIVESIEFLNAHHEILNEGKFGSPSNATVTYVIVIQVHDRLEYLRYLIDSLSNAQGVNQILLVFSHDLNSESINDLIKRITFCRAIQIFYPFNIQLFPNAFPGNDPSDCPKEATKEAAAKSKCTNWKYPDLYGHYRIGGIAQIKHHWWWKMNYVFDGIVKKYELLEKYVILLEEDHIVAPDIFHALGKMDVVKKEVCPSCEVLCLGYYLKNYKNYKDDIGKLGVEVWYSSKHNMGMAITAPVWEKLRNCSQLFCSYDDYNWDWSLMHLSMKCLPSKMRAIYTKAPRVIHIGDCGVHTHRCAAHNAANSALNLFERMQSSFFPDTLAVSDVSKRMLKPSKPNGGWGDIRDHQLCNLNTHPTDPANSFGLRNISIDSS